jgi:hypothetical protein
MWSDAIVPEVDSDGSLESTLQLAHNRIETPTSTRLVVDAHNDITNVDRLEKTRFAWYHRY